MRRRAADGPPDLIHLHELFRPPHLVLGRRLRSTPYVVSLHGAASPPNLARYRRRKALYGRLIERPLVRGADAVFALTWQERNDAYRWLRDVPPVRVVPNVADPHLLDAAGWAPPSIDDGSVRVVSLARWDVRHKGLDRLAALAAATPEVDVVVHGGPCGNEPELLAALRASAPPNLTLAPPVAGDDKVAALRGARAFILLSRWEGLAMAMLEAMALGVVCVVSDEVADTLGSGAPVVRLPEDPEAASAKLCALLGDEARLRATGRAGRIWAREHASPRVVAAATEATYREILAGGRPRTALAGA